jgi:hypothetical protein
LQRELRTIFGAISFNWIHMGDGDYPKVQDYIHCVGVSLKIETLPKNTHEWTSEDSALVNEEKAYK